MKRMVLGSLAMTHMTHWIEEAEARNMVRSAMIDHTVGITERQYLHLGWTIAKVSTWWHHKNHPRRAFTYARRKSQQLPLGMRRRAAKIRH
jgi:hypothetical protein